MIMVDEIAIISRAEQIKPQPKKIEGFEYQEELTEFHSKNKTGVWKIPFGSKLKEKGFIAVDVYNPDEIDLSKFISGAIYQKFQTKDGLTVIATLIIQEIGKYDNLNYTFVCTLK